MNVGITCSMYMTGTDLPRPRPTRRLSHVKPGTRFNNGQQMGVSVFGAGGAGGAAAGLLGIALLFLGGISAQQCECDISAKLDISAHITHIHACSSWKR